MRPLPSWNGWMARYSKTKPAIRISGCLKPSALAQANLVNWIGKLLFAHVLRQRRAHFEREALPELFHQLSLLGVSPDELAALYATHLATVEAAAAADAVANAQPNLTRNTESPSS